MTAAEDFLGPRSTSTVEAPKTQSAEDFLGKPLTPGSVPPQVSGDVPAPSEIKRFIPTKEQLPELAGSMAGAFMHDTPQGIALSAAGAGIGEAGRQAFMSDEQLTPKERAMKIGGAMLRGGLGETVGRGVSKMLTPFSGSFTPEIQGQVADFKSIGGEAPLANQSESKTVQAMDRMGEMTPFGQFVTAQKQKALSTLDTYSKKIGSMISADRPPEVTGNMAKQQLISFKEAYDATKEKLYDAVMPALRDQPVDLTNTQKVLDDIVSRRGGPGAPEGLGKIQKIADQIKSKPGIPSMLMSDTPGSITTFQELRNLRTNIGPKTNWADPATAGLQADYKNLYEAISSDLDRAAGGASKEVQDGLAKADEFYGQGKTTLRSKVFKALSAVNPENVSKVLVVPNNPSQIELGKELLGPDMMDDVARQWWDGMTRQATTNGTLSPAKILAQINRYGDSIPKLFEDRPDIMSAIQKLQSSSKLLTRGRDITQGSQTAYIGGTFMEALATIATLLRMPSASIGETAAELGTIGAAATLPALANTGIGKRYLTTGFPTAGKIAGRTTQIGTQDLEQKLLQDNKR